MGIFTRTGKALLTLTALLLLTVAGSAQCTNTSQYPSGTVAAGSGAVVTISTCSFEQEYSDISGIVSGNQYQFTINNATSYITVHQGSYNGPVIGTGTGSVTVTATASTDLFAHWNTNAACGTASSCRTTTVQNLGAPPTGCTNTSMYPSASFAAPAAGSSYTITTCQFGGEYNQMTGVASGGQYTFTSSVSTDYITIHSGTYNGPIVAGGLTPLTYTAASTADLYMHTNTNSACGTSSTCRTTAVSRAVSGCTNTTQYPSANYNAPASGTTYTITTCQFGGEYNHMQAVSSGVTYVFASSISTDFITIHSGTSNGPIVASGTTPVSYTSTSTADLFMHTSTNSACGTSSSCRTTTVQAIQPSCTNTTQYPSTAFTAPSTVGGNFTNTCQYAGEYMVVNGVVAGNTYTISSTIATDYFSVRIGTYNGTLVSAGTSTLTIVAPASGNWYVHTNTNSACGTQSSCRDITFTLTNSPCSAPTALTATAITGSSANIGWSPAGAATQWDVYYSTSSTAPTSGTTPTIDNTTTNPQPISGLSSGTTYYVWVRSDCGGGVTSGWAALPSFTTTILNDDCSGAITISCASTPVTGTTVGSSVDAIYSNCGAGGTNTTERGVWYKYIGDNSSVDVTTCDPLGSGYDSRLTVYSGNCGALTCVTGNDDMSPACATGSFRSEVVFNAVLGTDYYIFVHGYQSGTGLSATGNFALQLSCTALCSPAVSNEDCGTAQGLTVGQNNCAATSGSNKCASAPVSNPSCFSAFATLPDVWYSFVAPANPTKLTLTYNNGAGAATDLGFVTYGSCGGTAIQCVTTATSGVATTLTGLTSGSTYYIQVLGPLANRGSFDICLYYETCPAPSNVATSNITATSADLNWTENGTATAWDIYYGVNPATAPTSGTTPTIDNVTAHPTTLSGLSSGTSYQVWVRADCGGGDASAWIGPVNFTTLIPAADPCTTIQAWGACGNTKTVVTSSATGLWTFSSCDGFTTTDGSERIYTYTPTVTGDYTLSHNSFVFGNEQDFFYKPVSLGCNNSGWTCQEAVFSTGTSAPFTLTAGTQYYFMFDGELNTVGTGSSVDYVLNCPVVSTWTGTASTDWFDPNNWSPTGVPTGCSSSAFIPTNPLGSQFPVVVGTNATVGNLTVQGNATVSIDPGIKVQVCKTLSGGISTPGQVLSAGSIELNGTTVQDMSGELEVQNLILNNGAGANLNPGSFFDVFVELDLQTGALNTSNGTLRLRSTADNQIGIIDNFSSGFTGSLAGPVTAQRYYHSSSTYNAHFMSSPIDNAPLSQFGAGGTGGYAVPTATCDETQLVQGSPYGNVASMVEANGASCALASWHFENGGNANNGEGYSVRKSGAGVLSVNGNPNLGSSYSVSGLGNSSWNNVSLQGRPMGSGWHLVGNPYPAYLNISNTPSGFDAQKLVWHTSGAFAGSYQPATEVSPFQAFMVHVTTAGGPSQTYTINGSDRFKPGTPNVFQKTANDHELSITAANTASGLLDVTTVAFNQQATVNMDAAYDGYKVAGALDRHTLYSHNANTMEWLAVNTLKSIDETSTVPVGFEAGVSGDYNLSFNGISTFDPTSYITLEDKKLNTFHDVRSGDYSFTADATDNFDRFVLHFTPEAKVNTADASCNADGSINIEQPGTANWSYTLNTTNGVTLSSGSLNNSNPVAVTVPAGVYTLTLIDNNNYTVVKNIHVSGVQTITAGIQASTAAAETGEDIHFGSTATNATATQWDMGDGTILNGAMVVHNYSTAGIYNVSVNVTNAEGCSSSANQQITVSAKATGIDEVSNSGLNIWSNEDRVYVDFSKQKHVEATINIYNVLGQIVSSEKFGKSTIYSRELNNLEAGYVIVSVKGDNGVTTKKVFISNTK